MRGPNKVPLYAMGVVATVTITFIIVGDINTLAPIVTMPFLLTYACIDYSYFALAQTFDIQNRREERYRIQAQSPSYESRRYGSTTDHDNDLDHLFPDRTRHKTLSTPTNSPQHVPSNPNTNLPQLETPTNTIDGSHPDRVIFRGGNHNSTNGLPESQDHYALGNEDNERIIPDDEPIAPIRPPIHSKTKNWYSIFCNRWASLIGAGLKVLIMILVNWYYAITCIGIVLLVWFYVGTANPAVKPGLASEFRFFVWLKGVIFRCFGKRVQEYEQIVITPTCPSVDVSSTQMNDENADFSSRRRYHQSSIVQGRYVDDV